MRKPTLSLRAWLRAEIVVVAVLVLGTSACVEGAPSTEPDAAVADHVSTSTRSDGAVDRDVSPSRATQETGPTAESQVDNAWGFPLRKPATRTFDCTRKSYSQLPAQQVTDYDHVCSFTYKGVSGTLYMQATAVDCEYEYELVGRYSVRVWMDVDGQLTELDDPRYTTGGDHHNDALEFEFRGETLRLGRSTYNENYRGCQPMDCLRVYDAHDHTQLLENGCTTARSLPASCVLVKDDGSVPPLDAPFTPCPGGWSQSSW